MLSKKKSFLLDAGIILIALLLRIPFWPHQTYDWTACFAVYFHFLQKFGIKALGMSLGNAAPPFLILIYLLSKLPFPGLATLKFTYFLFEGASAFLGRHLLRQAGFSEKRSRILFAAYLFLPSIFMNGSIWGQSDSIFSFFLILSLYISLQQRAIVSFLSNESLFFLCYGTAFSFKLQSIFLGLYGARYCFLKKPKIQRGLWFFLPYLIFSIPLWLEGRTFQSILGIYPAQATRHLHMTFKGASLYGLLPRLDYGTWWGWAVLLAGAVILAAGIFIYRSKAPFEPVREIRIALLSCLLTVYFLPQMHDRYFYCAELFGLLLTGFEWSFAPVFFVLASASALSYPPYLFNQYILPLWVLSTFMGIAAAGISWDVWQDLRKAGFQKSIL